MTLDILFDGSCLRNGKPDASGGWGIVVSDTVNGRTIHQDGGSLPGEKQTNNRAELYAFTQALLFVYSHPEVTNATIKGDSELVLNGVKGIARRKANRDLWEPIEQLCSTLKGRLEVKKVCRETNTGADELAKIGANSLI